MNLQEALRYGETLLLGQGIEDARTDAWLLLEFVTGITRTRFLMDRASEMAQQDMLRYQELIRARGSHIPLQYLTHEQVFMGLPFYVNEHVLIPRQDTEILVEEALGRLKPGMKILDMCTGSGCIAVSLAKLGAAGLRGKAGTQEDSLTVDALDISGKALEVAAKNARTLGADVRFIQSSLFEKVEGAYDMIVSNPPYIQTAVIQTLSEEVRDHEPRLALDGMEDGLYFYRKIVGACQNHLNPEGWLLFEIGFDQGEQVKELMDRAGFTQIRVIKDLAGQDRVAVGKYSPDE